MIPKLIEEISIMWQKTKIMSKTIYQFIGDKKPPIDKIIIDCKYEFNNIDFCGFGSKALYEQLKKQEPSCTYTKGILEKIIFNSNITKVYISAIANKKVSDVKEITHCIYAWLKKNDHSFAEVIPELEKDMTELVNQVIEKQTRKKENNKKSKELVDITNPNSHGITNDDAYYYQEKKMINLLLNNTITPDEYQELYVLAHMDMPATLCIAKDIWLHIANIENYDKFNREKENIKLSLSERLEALQKNSSFIYKTGTGANVPLLNEDINKLDKKVTNILTELMQNKQYFDLLDLLNIKDNMWQKMLTIKSKSMNQVYQGYDQQEQDQPAGFYDQWDSMQAYNDYKTYNNINEYDIKKLIQLIVKMRFLSEFNNPERTQEFEVALKKKLFTMSVELFGVLNPENVEAIKKELNKLLFNEEDPLKIEKLVRNGADINAISFHHGMSVLGSAVCRKFTFKVMKLLDLGADVNLGCDPRGFTTLMLAFKEDMSDDIISRIIEKSTTINAQNNMGETALHLAIKNAQEHGGNKLDVIRRLLSQGALVTIKDMRRENTPLIAATDCTNVEVVKLMLNISREAIDIQNKEGDTALMVALQHRFSTDKAMVIIEELILAGADLNIKNKEGKNAFELVQKNKKYKDQVEKSLEKLAQQTSLGIEDDKNRFFSPTKNNSNEPNLLGAQTAFLNL